jgi:hypothetical protein
MPITPYLQTECPFTSVSVLPGGQPSLSGGGEGFAAAGAAEGGCTDGTGLIPAVPGCSACGGGCGGAAGLIAACSGSSVCAAGGGSAGLTAACSGCVCAAGGGDPGFIVACSGRLGCGCCEVAAFGGFVSTFGCSVGDLPFSIVWFLPAGSSFSTALDPVGFGPTAVALVVFVAVGIAPGSACRAATTPLPVNSLGLAVAAIVGWP